MRGKANISAADIGIPKEYIGSLALRLRARKFADPMIINYRYDTVQGTITEFGLDVLNTLEECPEE